MQLDTEATDGSYIEFKDTDLVWHHQYADPDFISCQTKELLDHLENVLANEPMVVKRCQHIVEVKPQVISKEVPLRCLLELHGFREQCELQDLIQFCSFLVGKYLVVGVVDGRNIQANDFASSLSTLASLEAIVGKDKLVVSTSCTRLSTLSTRQIKLDTEIKGLLLCLQKLMK
ncbi:alpha,alpha-trehalose-phosphate synthase [UDP-forming] 5-like isoform X1 [Zingiber officinale]|uniref:alpha,alpha-trehalose-phosphate synthase [UDP-forming] 5-like isoform X1 n=1 Tax=Zingiber officinale TaxID=94328 RepID=UPI001C4C1C6D|nr:alpha,alpha-trehalose-phosphate synthase [UDP-forming] 5-like isoform X1 [Zingiber officinale]